MPTNLARPALLICACLALLAGSCRQSQPGPPATGKRQAASTSERAGAAESSPDPAAATALNPCVPVEGTAKHGDKPAERATPVVPGVISGLVMRLIKDWPNPFDGKPPVEPFPGVTVKVLLEGKEEPVATAVSDAEGNYSFSGLPDGVYIVRVDEAVFKGQVIQPAPGYGYAVLPAGTAGLTFLDSNGFSAGKLAAGQAP